jgi:hypothetical protein
MWTTTAAILAEAYSRSNDAHRAESLYGMLRPGAGQFAAMGFGVASLGPISRHLGLLAATMGLVDEAVQHFEEAQEQEVATGGCHWLLRVKFDLARTLSHREGDGDAARAAQLLNEVGGHASDIGMETLAMSVARFRSGASIRG